MFKAIIKFAAVAATLLPVMAQAQTKEPTGPFGGNFTGLVTLTTDYSFRGISQTRKDPALQAGLNYDFPETDLGGFTFTPYVGFWGSSVKFFDPQNGADGASIELDFLPGIKGKLLDGALSYDLGLTLYRYPGGPGAYAFDEGRLSLGYDFGFAAMTVLGAFSPDYFGGSGDAYYVNAAASIPLGTYGAATPKLFGAIGYQWIEKNNRFGTPDYMDYQVGLGVNAWTVDFSLAYVGTDLKGKDCFNNAGPTGAAGDRVCNDRFILTMSKTF
jgi:uncharacterized protein (TIGR02001 family)